jgi:hypothetical protein
MSPNKMGGAAGCVARIRRPYSNSCSPYRTELKGAALLVIKAHGSREGWMRKPLRNRSFTQCPRRMPSQNRGHQNGKELNVLRFVGTIKLEPPSSCDASIGVLAFAVLDGITQIQVIGARHDWLKVSVYRRRYAARGGTLSAKRIETHNRFSCEFCDDVCYLKMPRRIWLSLFRTLNFIAPVVFINDHTDVTE